MNINAVRRFAELDQQRLEFAAEAKTLAKEADALEQAILEDLAQNPDGWSMNRDGTPQMRVNVGTDERPNLVLVHLNRTIWAKCVGEDWPRAVAALRDAGLDEFVETKYDSRKFSVYLRELDREGKPLPEPLVGAVEADVRLSLRTRRS